MRILRAVLSVLLFALGTALVAQSAAHADVITTAGDALRTGWYADQSGLGPTSVSAADFGQLWSTPVTGQVYAQPLVSQGTVLVATENNDIYGLSAENGAQIWTRHLHVPWNPADVGCADLVPTIGITGTPVIDPATNTAYFLAKTYASGTSGSAAWIMHAVNVADGAERPGFPVSIAGSATNAPSQQFDPTRQMQRPGLLLMDGVVYVGFGGHCTSFPYQGWVVGVSTQGVIRTLWATTSQAAGQYAAGIWQSGGGLVSDRPGSIVFSTGNGSTLTAPTAGTNPPASGFGVSVVRLNVQPNGSLAVGDFFAPQNAQALADGDVDLGSGAPLALPPSSFGTPSIPNLIVEVGKEGAVWLLNADDLGGFKQQNPGAGDRVVGRFGPDGGVWSKPTPWGGDGGWVYVPTAAPGPANTGSSGFLHAYKYGLDAGGKPTLALTGSSSDGFGFGSGTPVVTSDGTTTGSALVWTIWMAGGSGANAQLRAYDPVPVGGTMQLRRSFPIGTATKFSAPSVSGNRLFLGTRDGMVKSFGRQVTPALSGSPVAFGNTTVGQSQTMNAVLTAQQPVTVSGASVTGPGFSVGAPTPAFGTPLAPGNTVSFPVTFTPSAIGAASGTLTVTTASGISTVGLSGTGLSPTPLLTATPPSISFGGIAIGNTSSATITLGNAGAQPLQITSRTLPTSPFSATGVPAVGAMIPAGGSVAVTLTFSPGGPGSFSSALDLGSNGGSQHIVVSGTADTAGHLSVSPNMVAFPDTPVGGWTERTFTVTNTGGTDLTITVSKPPATAGFSALTSLPEGSRLVAGQSVIERIRFAPTVPGIANATWTLSGDGTSLPIDVTFSGNGVANAGIPSPMAGGWVVNGAASIQANQLVLTPPGAQQASGSAFWPTPVDPSNLRVSFDLTIDQGTGADGATFAFVPASTDPHSVGAAGGGLGWGNLGGVAIAFDTFQNPNDPSGNFVGISTSTTNKSILIYNATSTAIGELVNFTRHIDITTGGGHLIVAVDGVEVLDHVVALPSPARVAFTAGTGGNTNRHVISNASFTPRVTRPSSALVGPSVASRHDGTIAMAMLNHNAGISYRTGSNGSYGLWTSLGGVATSDPDLVSWGPGRVDVFVRGADAALWHRGWTTGSGWLAWERLGGVLASGPTAVSRSFGTVDVYAQGTDGALWTVGWTGSGWTGFTSLGGILTSDPDAASSSPGRADVFARGTDGALWHLPVLPGGALTWRTLGGGLSSGATAVSWAAGRLDVFARGTDGAMYGNYWDGTQWVGWFGYGGGLASAPDAASTAPNRIDVVARGTDDALYQRSWNGAVWNGWTLLGPAP